MGWGLLKIMGGKNVWGQMFSFTNNFKRSNLLGVTCLGVAEMERSACAMGR